MIRQQQLAHALALQRHGNFRRAAYAEHISQPAFSRSIRSLEDQVGARLFDRGTDGVKPTVFGEALLRRAASIVEQSEELEREIQLLKGLDSGGLAVAMAPYPAELSGSRAVGELIREHPQLRCQVTLGDWRQVSAQVLSREVDLGLAEVSVAEAEEELITEIVGQHDLVFYCRKNHPLAGSPTQSKSELDAYPLASIRVPPRLADGLPGKAEIDRATGQLIPAIEVEDLASTRAIVAASDAISAATPLQLAPWLGSGEFVVLPLRPSWLTLNYGFIYLRHRMLSPAVELYMRLVREIEQELSARNRALMQQWFPDAETSSATRTPATMFQPAEAATGPFAER